jgi:hypothetical protein
MDKTYSRFLWAIVSVFIAAVVFIVFWVSSSQQVKGVSRPGYIKVTIISAQENTTVAPLTVTSWGSRVILPKDDGYVTTVKSISSGTTYQIYGADAYNTCKWKTGREAVAEAVVMTYKNGHKEVKVTGISSVLD